MTNRFMDQIDGVVIQLVNESKRRWTILTDGTFGFEESFISFKDRQIVMIVWEDQSIGFDVIVLFDYLFSSP